MKRLFNKETSYRSPLGQVRNLGSSHNGTHHFIAQRLTAIALIPLIFWFVCCLTSMATATHAEAVEWINYPANTVLFSILILVLIHHAHLGLQMVVEDYIHTSVMKALIMVGMKFFMIALTVASVIAIFRTIFVFGG
ncbi:succinate dehydrogenase, hydrophobic membrane anchor protein [Candidatus Albibeggiatoa sp. nov. NOAA]|uniref:succinate dehydrogenase, hydrophobic membrane anchor protein n=1 Tax=Candidatus Albibeggiatoa sp. nov. NOAA TaxID=3162724 RepID=UPI0032F2308D|nr:succinate dehydrogenase, hydrophobic membrane anchor protein [Thiotrichaceae bacterium]